MAKDFRELLVEASRHDVFGRYFKELQIGLKVVMSFQASATHACEPEETLDDIFAYKKWEVTLRQINKPITVPKVGAWDYLKNNLWAKRFDKDEHSAGMLGEFLTLREAQQCYADVIEYAMANDQLDSEDNVRVVEPEENLKRKSGGGCGGCGGGAGKQQFDTGPLTKS